jgi:hypothetical protein
MGIHGMLWGWLYFLRSRLCSYITGNKSIGLYDIYELPSPVTEIAVLYL